MQTLEKKTIHCPNCQRKLQFTPSPVDRNAACPGCKTSISIPAIRVVVPEATGQTQHATPDSRPVRPARMSFRTKAEIGLVILFLGAGAAWLSRGAFSQAPSSGANSIPIFQQSRRYDLQAETKALEERRSELAGRMKVLENEVKALDLAIQQSLHMSQVKVTEVLAAFEKESRQ